MLYDSIAQQNHINFMMKRFFLLKPPRLLFEPTEIDDRDAVKQTLNGFTRAPCNRRRYRTIATAKIQEANASGDTIDYAKFYSRSHDAMIRVYDAAGNVIETHEHAGDFK